MKSKSLCAMVALIALLAANFSMGAVTWQKNQLLDVSGTNDDAVDVQVAPNGNVCVGGISSINNGSGWRTRHYLAIYRDTLGTALYTGYAPSGNPPQDQRMSAMAISSGNNVAFTGSGWAAGASYFSAYTTLFNNQASLQWNDYYDGVNKNKEGTDVAFDASGNAYVTICESVLHSYNDGYFVKYNGATGNRDWIVTYSSGNGFRYFPKAVVAGTDGYIYVAVECYHQDQGGNWPNVVQVYKYSPSSNSQVAVNTGIQIQYANNTITDLIYVPCTSPGCSGGSKVVMVTQDGIAAFNTSNLSLASQIQRQGYKKAASFANKQFAAVGTYGVGKFDIANVATPIWECTSVTTYVDVATTKANGIACIDTYNSDYRVTYFPITATGCGGAETASHDGGSSVIDSAVAVATANAGNSSIIYVTGKKFGTTHDYLTMRFTASNPVVQCTTSVGTPYYAGDADGSGFIDISDAVFLISYIFGGGPAPNPLEAGDADGSGFVDISDVVYLIAYIFSGGPAPVCPY